MKKNYALGALLLLVISLISCDGGKKYTLTGNIDGTKAEEAYLAIGEKLDTVAVENGSFVFEGQIEEPVMTTLVIEGRQTNIMLEASNITIEGAIDALVEAEIVGSESQIPFDEFLKEFQKHQGSREDYLAFCKEFIASNAEAYFTPYVIASIAPMVQPKEVQEMLNSLSEDVKATAICQKFQEQLDEVMALSEGGTAPDFSMNDVNGNSVQLSKVYAGSKYLLIDFWASWCAPCRKENPNLVATYAKYNAKGFEILGVSLDKDSAAWLAAITSDKLTWKHVSDLKGWDNAAAKQYKIQSVPSNLLVDSQGKIIATDLRGPALGAKLSELLD